MNIAHSASNLRRAGSAPLRALRILAATTILLSAIAESRALAQNSLWSWGDNQYGQLGDTTNSGTTSPNPTPAQVALSNVTAVAAGDNFSVALGSSGNVWGWGINQYGQLGTGVTIGTNIDSTPTQIVGLSNITAIAACKLDQFLIALKSNGTVWGLGINNYGQMGSNPNPGTGQNLSFSTPQQIIFTNNNIITTICAGYDFAYAIDTHGVVWAWGTNSHGQLGTSQNWGNGAPTATPQQVSPSTLSGITITAVAAGGSHGLALSNAGAVYAWGANEQGQCGTMNDFKSDLGPVAQQVAFPQTVSILAIAAGNSCSYALDTSGNVWAWGANTDGQLGNPNGVGDMNPTDGFPTPAQISGLTSVKMIASGDTFCLAIKNDGTVWAWGGDDYGQLGNDKGISSTPTQIAGLANAVTSPGGVSGGMGFVLALLGPPHYNGFIWQNQSTGQLAYWDLEFESGVPTAVDGSYLSLSLKPPWKLVAVADFNKDGAPDILWWNSSTGQAAVWYMSYSPGTVNGVTYPTGTASLVSSGVQGAYVVGGLALPWKLVGAADFNGDGYPDLLWQNTQTGGVAWQPMALVAGAPTAQSGGGTFLQSLSLAWSVVGAKDLNRDGYPDILLRNASAYSASNTSGGDVAWWNMAYVNGSPTIVSSGVIAQNASLSERLVTAIDLNGDGEPDLLWQNVSTGALLWQQLAYQNGAVTEVGNTGSIYSGLPVAWLLGGGF